MKRIFRRFLDDRFALTTLQNPTLEVRAYAELCQAAERERQNQPGAAPIPATQEQPSPGDSDAPVTLSWAAPASPDPLPAALAPLDAAIPDSPTEAVQQLADLLGVSLAPESPALPEVEVDLTNHPRAKTATKSQIQTTSRIQPAPISGTSSRNWSHRARRSLRAHLGRASFPQMLHLQPS